MAKGKQSGGCCGPIALALIVLVAFIIWAGQRVPEARRGQALPPSAPAPPVWTPETGEIGRLGYRDGGGKTIWLALEEAAWDAMLNAQNQAARGGPGAGAVLFKLAEAHKVRAYPVGTRVRVVGSGLVSRKVEVLEGEDAGDTGWVQVELVQPDR